MKIHTTCVYLRGVGTVPQGWRDEDAGTAVACVVGEVTRAGDIGAVAGAVVGDERRCVPDPHAPTKNVAAIRGTRPLP
jgi:hypothetical protein